MEAISPQASYFRQLEERLIQPNVRQSVDELAALLADSFVEFGSSGRIYHKQDIIAALQSETVSQITISDFQMQKLGTEIVLVTYKATRQTFTAAAHSLRSSIWQCISGQWQIVFHQGTPIN